MKEFCKFVKWLIILGLIISLLIIVLQNLTLLAEKIEAKIEDIKNPKKYILSYDMNDGFREYFRAIPKDLESHEQAEDPDDLKERKYRENEQATVKSWKDFELFGRPFLGWSENKNATEAQYTGGDTIKMEKNKTLYAVWGEWNEPETNFKIELNRYYPEDISNQPHEVCFEFDLAKDTKLNAIMSSSILREKNAIGICDPTGEIIIGKNKDIVGDSYALKEQELSAGKYYMYIAACNDDWDKDAVSCPQLDRLLLEDAEFSNEDGYYCLTYDSNGAYEGDTPVDSNGKIGYKEGEKAVVLGCGNLKNFGRIFVGWSEDRNANEASYQEGDHIIMQGDTTLYALWEWEEPSAYTSLSLNEYHKTENDDLCYMINVENRETVDISLEADGYMFPVTVGLYDEMGTAYGGLTGSILNSTTVLNKTDLSPGKYYLQIDNNSEEDDDVLIGVAVTARRDGFDLTENSLPVLNRSDTLVNVLKTKNNIARCFGYSSLAVLNYKGLLADKIDKKYIVGQRNINTKGYDELLYDLYPMLTDKKGIDKLVRNLTNIQHDPNLSGEFHLFARAEYLRIWLENETIPYGEFLSRAEENSEPIVIVVMDKKDLVGHTIVTDTSRIPLDMGDGWYRVYIYDSNNPYYEELSKNKNLQFYLSMDTANMSKVAYAQALDRFIEINDDGRWRFEMAYSSEKKKVKCGDTEITDGSKDVVQKESLIFFLDLDDNFVDKAGL